MLAGVLLACRPAAERTPRLASRHTQASKQARAALPEPAAANGAPAREPDEAASAATEDWLTTVVDLGKSPHRHLRYELAPGSTHEFRVEHRLTLFEGDEPRGSVEVHAPLVIAVGALLADAHALRLQLGPAQIAREGEADTIGWGGAAHGQGESDARLLAQAHLTRSGRIREARIVHQSGSELVPLYETLLELDGPPDASVGAGARWNTELRHRGAASTKTEYELVELAAERATFRVQRQQLAGPDAAGVRAFGEWTFTRDAWPPTGYDQTAAALPEAGPRARLSVRFAVTRHAGAAHSGTQAP
ncbi:MAG TPA: hypothetical protein VI197_30430 [Polyangiaceae bacterium]